MHSLQPGPSLFAATASQGEGVSSLVFVPPCVYVCERESAETIGMAINMRTDSSQSAPRELPPIKMASSSALHFAQYRPPMTCSRGPVLESLPVDRATLAGKKV